MAGKTVDFEALLKRSDDDLLNEVGQLTADSCRDDSSLEALGLGAGSLGDLGSAIFKRLNREAHELICGDGAESKDERTKLKKMLSLDAPALSAALTSVLIYYFAVSLPIASLVAVLIVKRVIIPTTEELCSHWAKQIA